MSAYIDVEDLKNAEALAGTSFLNDEAERAISAASDTINTVCDRSFDFTQEEDGETRYFTPTDRDGTRIDDIASISELLVDRDGDGVYEETWVEGTDYRLEPLNAPSKGRPYQRVVPLANQALPTTRLATIKVTGMFGWENLPDSIVQATLIIATRLIQRRMTPFGVIITTDAAVRIARSDPDVGALLDGYLRKSGLKTPQLA